MHRPAVFFSVLTLLVGVAAITMATYAAGSGTASISLTAGAAAGGLGTVSAVGSASGSTTAVSAPGERGTSGAPLTLASSVNFSSGDPIKVCLDGGGCASYAYRAIRSLSGAQAVLDSPITLSATGGAVTEEPAYAGFRLTPSWTPVVGSVSAISPGGLFHLDLTPAGTGRNVLVTLFVTNPDTLSGSYSYLNQRVNVYILCPGGSGQTCPRGAAPFAALGGVAGNAPSPVATDSSAGAWIQATDAAGASQDSVGIDASPRYMSLSKAMVTFVLKGGYVYDLALDGGTAYTISSAGQSLSPSYYVALDPA
ncbi:MAG: hypothetical protein Q8O40_02310 [Chloroflexota bacterium]|nr:hypothetical protein [Chloroflexota bacterium]